MKVFEKIQKKASIRSLRKTKTEGSLDRNSSSTYSIKGVSKQLDFNDEEESRIFPLLPVVIQHLERVGQGTKQIFLKKSSDPDEAPHRSLEIQQQAAKELCSHINNPEAIFSKHDQHTWANVLKLLLKELKAPLIPKHLVESLVEIDLDVADVRVVTKQLVDDIPHRNVDVLRDLCLLLAKCGTDVERLAHAFGAILLQPPEREELLDSMTMIKQAQAMTKVMRSLITDAVFVFELDPSSMPEYTSSPGERFLDISTTSSSSSSSPCAPPPLPPKRTVSNIVTALFDYSAQESDELPLSMGETILVLSKVNQDWYRGKKRLADGTEQEGIFPGAFCGLDQEEFHAAKTDGQPQVEPPTHSNTSNTSISTRNSSESVENGYSNTSNTLVGQQSSISTSNSSESVENGYEGYEGHDEGPHAAVYALAIYDFDAVHDVELSISAGERLRILNDSDPEWYFGENSYGREGLFPREYVRLEEESTAATSQETKPVVLQGDLLVRQPATKPSQPQQTRAASSVQKTEWRITKNRYSLCYKFFLKLSVEHHGVKYVSREEATKFLLKSKLSQDTVTRVFAMADIDQDQWLDRDEFIVAHHLAICISNEGMPEPHELPAYLVPKTKRPILP